MNPVRWKLPAVLIAATALGTAWAVAPTTSGDKPTPPAKPAVAVPVKKPVPSTYTQRRQSRNNLKNLGLAVHNYWDAHGHLPADIVDKHGKPLLSWRVAILPQLDNEFLYSHFKLGEPWDSEHNKKLLAHMPKVFRSPVQGTDPASETYLQGFAGPGAGFETGKKLNVRDFADGTSTTLMLAEAGPPVPWTKPADRPYDPKKPLPAMDGPYADRIITTFWDGSVHDLRWNLNEKTYRLLIERSDANVVPHAAMETPPSPPLTEEDKRQVERLRKTLADRAGYYARAQAEYQEVLDKLKQTGGVPEPTELGPDAGIEDWMAQIDKMMRRESLLGDEIERLRKEVKKRKEGRK